MGSSTTIVVDVHERRSGIPGLLEELGATVQQAALPAGDYAVSADTLVERKRVLDLHSAITRGRLWGQMGKLRSASPFPQRTERHADRPLYAQRPKPRIGDPAAEAVLAAIPGVSVTTARALLARFGSVASVLRADPDEWLTVPGVGPERARVLAEALSHHWSPGS